MLRNIVLQAHYHDKWRWLLDPINDYSVKGTYQYLTTVEAPSVRGVFDFVWHKHVSLKVSSFAWRLFRERLATKDNLARRRVLHTDDTMCMGDCGVLETADHLLFSCDTFGSVWSFVLQWLGYLSSLLLGVGFIFFSLDSWLGYRSLHIRTFG